MTPAPVGLRPRVLGALAGLLLLTVLGAWLLAFAEVLRPLMGQLVMDRVDLTLFVMNEIEESAQPARRAEELAQKLHAEVRISPEPPGQLQQEEPRREFSREGRRISVYPGKRTPILVQLERLPGEPWLVLWFPVDLHGPRRRANIGMLLLAMAAIGAAMLATRWVLAPLEGVVAGMNSVADGELGARLPEGDDVTGRIGARFNLMAGRVQALVEGQRRLLAGVSHELRSPLARMRLNAELVAEGGLPPALGRHLDAISADIDEVDGLVGELLEAARLERGFMALRLEDIDVPELLAEALGAVDLGERSVRLEVDPGLALRADRARLLRALCNLLSNVVRYTPDDSEIELAARAGRDASVRFTVADRGPGVADDELPRLFEPFFRTDASRSRETGGLGLGLMLVRQIAEAHGGAAIAENRDGGGLAIHLDLPAATEKTSQT